MDNHLKSHTVLLVDDQAIIGQAVQKMLSGETDIDFHYCQDPTQAIKIANHISPTVILQDLVMPEIEGLLLVRYFRANQATREVPLIVLSSKEEPLIKAEAFALGANDYLVKLPDRLEMLARIRYHSQGYVNFLQRNEARRALEKANAEITELNKRLKSENLRMSTELDVARHLQKVLLPTEEELKQIHGLDIACFMEPADEVGGDYYDVIQTAEGLKIGIGDVTGHGLESGIFSVMVQMGVQTLLTAQEDNPVKFFSTLNKAIYANIQRMHSDKNMTLVLLDYRRGDVRISGQHEEVIIVRQGEVARLDTLELGFPVGLVPEIGQYVSEINTYLNPGDGIVLYTDGITEAENDARQLYGIERLCSVIKTHWQHSAAEIKDAIIDEVRRYIGSQHIYDDMSLLILKRLD